MKAFASAKAKCGPGFATSQVKATVFKKPLGTCKAPGLTSPTPGYTEGRPASDDDTAGGSSKGPNSAGDDDGNRRLLSVTDTVLAGAQPHGRRML